MFFLLIIEIIMASVNKVILIGNLGRDPELRSASSGAILNFSLATSRRYKDKAGQYVSETEWHSIVAFGRTAEVIAQYCRKGSPLYVEGRLRTRKWQDQSGRERFSTEIVCESMQLLSGREQGGSAASDRERQERANMPPDPGISAVSSSWAEEDIPF